MIHDKKADRWLDVNQPLLMKVLVLFIFVLAPLWVCEAKLNIQGLASGLRAILGSVSKTVVKKTIKEIGSKSLKQIEESFTRKLSLKQQEDEDIAIAIVNKTVDIGRWLNGNAFLVGNPHSSYPNSWEDIRQFYRKVFPKVS